MVSRSGIQRLVGSLGLLPVLASGAFAFPTGISSTQFDQEDGCNQCHSGGQTPMVLLTGPTNVPPGSTHEYLLAISEIGMQRSGGLNVSASAGVLSLGGGQSANTRTVIGAGGMPEITHSAPKGAVSGAILFSFLWTAPSGSAQGTLTAWGNAVDRNGALSGDKASKAVLRIGGSSLCGNRPLNGCKTTGTNDSLLLLKQGSSPAKNKLTFKWLQGGATTQDELGDPVSGSTEYAFCVYDTEAAVSVLILNAAIPAGGSCGNEACWQETAKGYSYTDHNGTAGGITKIVLEAGSEGQTKITVQGKGANLVLPALPLFQEPEVVAQLVNSEGTCWEAHYSAPATKNTGGQFKDKSD